MADVPLETETIGGRQCYLYIADGTTTLLIQPVDSHDRSRLDTEVAALRGLTTTPFSLVAIGIDRWRDELTPWSAPSIFKEKPFGDGARATLDYITDTLLPCCNERWGKKKTILGGYSLAGLFALWAGYNTDCFDAIAAASPGLQRITHKKQVDSRRSQRHPAPASASWNTRHRDPAGMEPRQPLRRARPPHCPGLRLVHRPDPLLNLKP